MGWIPQFLWKYDGLLYVRMNGLGAFALGSAEVYDAGKVEPAKLFKILPTQEIQLLDPALDPADRAALELLASPRKDGVWAIDPERILAHLEQGGSFKELQQFLESNAEDGVPDEVDAFLSDMHGHMRACRTRKDAILLFWRDEALARTIAETEGTRELCFHAGGNRIVVPSEKLGAFTRALRQRGYALPTAQNLEVS